jgi:hypothetical protein
MPRQRHIIFQPISPIEVTAIAFWEVVSQVNAINHVLLINMVETQLKPNWVLAVPSETNFRRVISL